MDKWKTLQCNIFTLSEAEGDIPSLPLSSAPPHEGNQTIPAVSHSVSPLPVGTWYTSRLVCCLLVLVWVRGIWCSRYCLWLKLIGWGSSENVLRSSFRVDYSNRILIGMIFKFLKYKIHLWNHPNTNFLKDHFECLISQTQAWPQKSIPYNTCGLKNA